MRKAEAHATQRRRAKRGAAASWPGAAGGSHIRADDLVGRAAELDLLETAYERSRAGVSQVVVIEGEPGIGKSTLLHAFLDSVDTGAVLPIQCDEFETDVAGAALGLLLDEPTTTGSEVEAGRCLLARLSELQASEHEVTVLGIDDAQWMDRLSARALRFALRRLQSDQVLTVIARRPVSARHEVIEPGPDRTTNLRPTPMTADSVRQLVWQQRSWDLPVATAERLVRRTGGVPLLLSTALRGASDLPHLMSGTDVPATVEAAAQQWLHAVPHAARRLAEATAVLATPTELVVAGQVAAVDDPFAAAEAAAVAGLVRLGPDDMVGCSHDLLREAIYHALAPSRRHELHGQAAAWTHGDRRLAHRAAAADRPDAPLAAELADAAQAARRSLQHHVAATQWLRARSVAGDPEARDRFGLEALIDRIAALDLPAANELADVVREAPPSGLRSLALGLLARESGRIAEARTLLHDARTRAEEGDEPELLARARLAAAILHVRVHEGAAAVEVIADTDRVTDPDLAGEARTNKGLGMWQSGQIPEALALLDAAPISRDGSTWEAELVAVRGMIRLYDGQLTAALADLDRAVELVHLWRPSTNQSRIYVIRSGIRYRLGDWDGAATDAAAARSLADLGAQAWSVPLAHAASIDVAAHRGHWKVAAEHLAAAKKGLTTLSPLQSVDFVASHETSLLLARRDYEAVADLLEPRRHEEAVAPIAAYRPHRWVLPGFIVASIELGRLTDADEAIGAYEAMLQRWPGGPAPSRLGWLRGLLAERQRDPQAARRHYADDLQDPELAAVPFLHAEVLHSAGRLERVHGQRHTAIAHLRRAQSILTQLGAAPLLDRYAVDLVSCGLRSSVITSSSALTGRESEVAALVGRGYTNKEVAADLFLTSKGVEYHLGNIYAKLGLSGRRELRRLQAPREVAPL